MKTLENLSVLILAGGKATRMGSICVDVPKPMIPFAGKPFLYWLVNWYFEKGVAQVIIAGGYNNADYYQAIFCTPFWYDRGLRLVFEPTQLGTGGAIKYCLDTYKDFSKDILICNGDTILDYDVEGMYRKYTAFDGDITALLTLDDNAPNRGSVKVSRGRVISFDETGEDHYVCSQDSNNYLASSTGHYLAKSQRLRELFPQKVSSLETEVLPMLTQNYVVNAILADDRFFYDYGTPNRYDWLKRNESIVSSIYSV